MTLYNITDWAGVAAILVALGFVVSVLPTAMMQFHRLIKNTKIRNTVNMLCGAFTAFMMIGCLLSGVHWFTDILVGVIFSTGLILMYSGVNNLIDLKAVKEK